MKEGIGALAENTDPFQCICTRLQWVVSVRIPLQQKANSLFFPSYKAVDPSAFDSRFYEIWGFSVTQNQRSFLRCGEGMHLLLHYLLEATLIFYASTGL